MGGMHPEHRSGRLSPFLIPAVLISIGAGLWSLPTVVVPDSHVWKGEAGSAEFWMVILGGAALIGSGILFGVILFVLRLHSRHWALRDPSPSTPHSSYLKHHKVRIAWSMAWGLLAMIFCMLRLKSYWMRDTWVYDGRAQRIEFESVLGWMTFETMADSPYGNNFNDDRWHIYHTVPPRNYFELVTRAPVYYAVPHAAFVVLGALTAALPWLRPRFSLRTLLIATTLFALVLGIIVWMARAG
jgi:hypothetical protein